MDGLASRGAASAAKLFSRTHRRSWASVVTLLLLACLCLGTAQHVRSEQPEARASLSPLVNSKQNNSGGVPTVPQPTRPLDAADLESWLDGMLPAALEQGKVAGVVVSVVKDGRVLLAKGYGYSDVASKRPMDARSTLVRPGSTSKLFTWTAVMQLVEQGKLDLNADVNRYLDFKIPEQTGRPITLTDLMTHRAGFEEGLKDVLAVDPARFETFDAYMKGHVRPVMFPPGAVPAYSNYGTALAGYIVQRVSGERYEDYVARHILQPLAMTHSTFRQPLPAALAGSVSKGYRTSEDAPQPFELVTPVPAGGLSSTATDMANFMLAHLQDGQLGDARILQPQTARLMHSASLPHPPGFDTMAHGFFLNQRNGRAVLEHGGDSIVFHSDLAIIPAERVGIFFSFNSRGEGDATYGMRERLLDGFMDRYFPGPAATNQPAAATAKAHGEQIAGRYESSRRVQSGFISLFYVLQGQDVVSLNPDATISVSSSPGKTFREVAPYLWREVGGFRQIAMQQVDGVTTLIDSRNPAWVLQLVSLRRNAAVNLAIFVLSLVALLAAALAWPAAEIIRRGYRQPPTLTGHMLTQRRIVRIAAVADLLYLFAWFAVLKPILATDVAFYTTALDPVIRVLQIAAIVPVIGAVMGSRYAWRTVRSSRSWIAKLGVVLVAVALIGVVWIAFVGGLMSFTLNY